MSLGVNFFTRGDAPGLGVDYKEKLAAQFPYKRSYLSANRKLDGSMHDW